MKRTGEYLKKAREEKGLVLAEIASSLKINSKVLIAIEDGDMAKLPAKTFLRGFVQSYAQALKTNVDEVMTIFTEEMGSTRPQPEIVTPDAPVGTESGSEPPPEAAIPGAGPMISRPKNPLVSESPLQNLEEPHRIRTIVLSVVSVILIILIFGSKKLVERYQRESQTSAISVANPLPTETTTTLEPLVVAENLVSPSTTIPLSTLPEKMASTIPPSTLPAKVTTTTTSTLPPTTTTAKPIKAPLELIVEALDGVDVEYSSANGPTQKLHLNAEQVHTIRSKSGVKLSVTNGGAVNLILNGKDLGVPGDLGKPIKLSY